MAKTKKRVLSLLMAAVMMLSALPMNAYAWSLGDVIDGIGDMIDGATELAEIITGNDGKGKLVCTDENHCQHGEGCYAAHQHTDSCTKHSHSVFSGCYNWRGKLTCSKEYDCNGSQDLICTMDAHNDDCYINLTDIQNQLTETVESAEEAYNAAVVFGKCWLGGGKCGISYQLGEVKLNLCKEHFCDVCSRLKDDYCNCVEITFANIKMGALDPVTVKVKNDTAVPAEKVPADTFVADYEFEGWFDANGNEFSTETTFTEDTTFNAQYRALTEVEKFQNIISFIENNFDLGTEIGRIITLVSGGKITKEYVLENKDTALSTIDKTALAAMLTGQFTLEQYNELCAMMREGDEYVVMVAEWLWPENAVMMPTIEEILNGIDCEKLAAEIKDMIAEYYGVEFTEEWINENRALAEQYIIECLREVKSITEQQKAALLEQIAQEKAEAREFINNLVSEIRAQIKAEIENAKDYVKAVLADRELGLKIGKTIAMITGLNNEKASEKSALVKGALISAIRMSGMNDDYKNAIIALMNSGDSGMAQVINWMWPIYTVSFVVNGEVVESDIAEHGTMPSFDGVEPTKAADAQYTYTFGGWDKEFSAVTENVTYTAEFDSTVNEYTVTFVNEDGAELDTQTVAYGATPVYAGATPEKAADAQYTYTFNGWTPAVEAVTGDATYTATFAETVNEYTVTFVDEDGNVLDTQTVAYGETPVYAGTTPSKESNTQYNYTFKGWYPAVETVTGDATYTATFNEVLNKYTVIVMSDGKEIAKKSFDYGTQVTADVAPATSLYKEGYDCIGWKDSEGNDITFPFALTGDVTIHAVWQIQTYTVTWVDADGTVLETDDKVPYGTVATYNSAEPTKAADERYIWTFSNFQDSKFPVTGNVTYRATYVATDRLYTVTFVYGDTVIKTEEVKYEAAATAPVATAMPVVKNHEFSSWDVDFSSVTGDMTVTARYERTHNDEWDLKVGIGYGGVSGSDSTAGFIDLGNAAKKAGKIYDVKVFESFKNWPKSTIMEGTDYSYYTVKEGFLDVVKWNGVDYYNETNNENLTHEDYFQIYRVELVATKGQYHLDNHATFYHTVTFVVDNKEYKIPVVHGEKVALPEGIDTSKEGYNFTGWDTDFSGAVKKSMTVTALYEVELADREVELVAIVDGEAVVIGSTTIKNAALAEITGVGAVENYELGEIEQLATVTHGGLEYTYSTKVEDVEHTVAAKAAILAANIYNFGDVTGVEVVKDGDEYRYRAVCGDMERFHKVTFGKPAGRPGVRVDYVKHGEKITPYYAEDALLEYEAFTYWYNGQNQKGIDFDTYVVTRDVTFSTQPKNKIGDWDVALIATIGDEIRYQGTAKITNFLHAGCYRNAPENIQFDAENLIMPEIDLGIVEQDGIKYYSDSSKAHFYTVEFNNLRCVSPKTNSWAYQYVAEIKLYHTVIFEVEGDFYYVAVEHGTAAVVPEGFENLTWAEDFTNVTNTMIIHAN